MQEGESRCWGTTLSDGPCSYFSWAVFHCLPLNDGVPFSGLLTCLYPCSSQGLKVPHEFQTHFSHVRAPRSIWLVQKYLLTLNSHFHLTNGQFLLEVSLALQNQYTSKPNSLFSSQTSFSSQVCCSCVWHYPSSPASPHWSLYNHPSKQYLPLHPLPQFRSLHFSPGFTVTS